LSDKKGNLDKAITHLTEAVLLSFRQSQDVVHMFFQLATTLLSRFIGRRQLEDVKSSLKYFRFLRINFHPLKVFDIPHGQFMSRLLEALVMSLESGSGDMIQDMEEMVAIMPEVLALDVTEDSWSAIKSFSDAVTRTEIFRRKHTQEVAERLIQILREATVLKPDSHIVSFALANCLADRFQTNHVIKDHEEAIAIADKIVAAHSPEDSLTLTQALCPMLILRLLVYRLNSYSRPEYLEDAIHRIRTLLSLPSLPDDERTQLTTILDNFVRLRFRYFGVTGNSGETPPTPSDIAFVVLGPARGQWDVDPVRLPEKYYHLRDILAMFLSGEITDVDAAVERSRNTSLHSNLVISFYPLACSLISSSMRIDSRIDWITSMKQLPHIVIFAGCQPQR
jgi:hypothetical protein